jgi:hypothetical protein
LLGGGLGFGMALAVPRGGTAPIGTSSTSASEEGT